MFEHLQERLQKDDLFCEDLEALGLWDTSQCCKECHATHPEEFHGLVLAVLRTGHSLFVCGAAKTVSVYDVVDIIENVRGA
ncbi:hypothetical protein EI42_06165 [Thermosporothrix hazakensis]|jgi:hypothetical protein|uniref:Uncharacterized protein n=1 Tax=Thermosporothrix hazakensis TaxID=644383 RepID=A0A326TRF7_THEHA|nr:hypothetical protein EI42_06165 [Thermosporothrix hazakensis]GCE45153.1 hypothetical protein KTH_00220 [Thermosporothrix hazakensis]